MKCRRAWRRRAAWVGLLAVVAMLPGCVSGFDDGGVGELIGDVDGDADGGDGAVREIGDGGQPAANERGAGGDGGAGGDVEPRVSPERPEGSGDADEPAGGDEDAALAQELTALLGDKLLEFGDAQFFSSGSISENTLLQLCGFGRFGRQVTTITSTSLDTFSSEDLAFGTWSIEVRAGAAVLVLNVDDASDPAALGRTELAIGQDGAGVLLIDGLSATVRDVAADCAAAQP